MTLTADRFLRRFLLHVLPKAWSAFRHFGLFANRRRETVLARCRELLGAATALSTRKQRICHVAPPVQQPCWSSNDSPVLNFTSSLTCASPLHRGASSTAHKTAMAHDESSPLAPWHARACKATLCLQAAHAPCLRHRLTPYGTQFHSQTGLPLLQGSRSPPEILQISQSATLKIHR
jgi:hypothetical protein